MSDHRITELLHRDSRSEKMEDGCYLNEFLVCDTEVSGRGRARVLRFRFCHGTILFLNSGHEQSLR